MTTLIVWLLMLSLQAPDGSVDITGGAFPTEALCEEVRKEAKVDPRVLAISKCTPVALEATGPFK